MLDTKILSKIFILRRFFAQEFFFSPRAIMIQFFAKKQAQSLDYRLRRDAAIIKVKLYLSERRYSARIEINKQFHCLR